MTAGTKTRVGLGRLLFRTVVYLTLVPFLFILAVNVFDLNRPSRGDGDEVYDVAIYVSGHDQYAVIQAEIFSNIRGSLLNVRKDERRILWNRHVAAFNGENITVVVNVWNEALRSDTGWTRCQILLDGEEMDRAEQRVNYTKLDRSMHVTCKKTFFL